MSDRHGTDPEVWRPIPLTRNTYEASSLGRIRSVTRLIRGRGRWGEFLRPRTGRVLRQQLKRNGYCHVAVGLGSGHTTTFRVHKLIADAFHGPCPDGFEINHKDGNRANNRPDNLEYVTRSDNHRHAYRVLGRKNNTRRFTDEQIAKIRATYSAGGISYAGLSRMYGANKWYMREIIKLRSRPPRHEALVK